MVINQNQIWLRQLIIDEDLLFNLVFESSDVIVGNVVVSKITMEPDAGFIMRWSCSALSVKSEFKKSIHWNKYFNKLMRAAFLNKSKLNFEYLDALFLLGDPNYYKRFDFKISNLPNDYSFEHFQELELTKNCLNDVRSKVI